MLKNRKLETFHALNHLRRPASTSTTPFTRFNFRSQPGLYQPAVNVAVFYLKREATLRITKVHRDTSYVSDEKVKSNELQMTVLLQFLCKILSRGM